MALDERNLVNEEIKEEVLDRADAISLSLDDEKIKNIIGKRIENGVSFWDSKLNLSSVRKENEQRWLNKNFEVSKQDQLYDHETDYRDNRIFVSVETLVANILSRLPIPEVIEAFDTDASRELANNFSKVLSRKAEDVFLKPKLQMVARHLLMGYRAGIMKTSWDFNAGRLKGDSYTGDVDVNYIRPHRVVIDAEAEDPDDIPLIAENMQATVEELGIRFPDKKDELIKLVGASIKTPRAGMATKIGYWEVWFSFWDKGVKREGVCWKYRNLILDYGIHPYYNYEGGAKSNFFDKPRKPYTFFNFLRIGRWVYDDTSLTEQASSQQDILEKRGRQIVETADQAHSAKIFNTMMIDAKDAEKYIGNPRQNILCKGDARQAFARVPPEILPKYVIEDKFDARREVDEIFSTHAPIRGSKTNSPTLGQEVLSQRADIGRQATLSEAMEAGAAKVYKHITQLYKVFATEEHVVKYLGSEEGRTTFVKFSSDKIEDGIEIRVKAGSMAPEDKMSDRTEAVELAKTGKLIDPLTFAEKWHIEKPREKAKRSFLYMFMPEKYAQEILRIGGGGGDQQAMQTIQRINAGENVPPAKDPSKEYIAMYKQFIEGPAFKQLDPEVQRLHIEHIRATIEQAKSGLKEGGQEGQEGVQEKPGIRERIGNAISGKQE